MKREKHNIINYNDLQPGGQTLNIPSSLRYFTVFTPIFSYSLEKLWVKGLFELINLKLIEKS